MRSLASCLGHFVLVELLLRLLDQREHVAHAEDAAGHPLGMELLQGIEVLAGADELDRHAGDGLDRSAAPPRASPSSLVMITPSSSSASLNAFALRTASWPVIASTTRIDLIRPDAAVDLRQLAHQLSSTCSGRPCRG